MSKISNGSKTSKRFSLGKDKSKRTGYNCMQQRGFSNGFLSGGIFTWRSFLVQFVIGIIGVIGVIFFSPAIEAIRLEESIEPLKILAFLVSVFFVMGGLFGIYDLIREFIGF